MKFYTHTVFGAISNTDYEGEITSYGDKVHIRTVPDITIRDYEVGADLSYENPESANVELQISHGKYFAFGVEDVDKYQSDIDLMSRWSDDGGQKMKIEIDRDILADIYADADADNSGTTAGKISGDFNLGASTSPLTLTSTNIIDTIVNLGTVLDEQDVPEEDRWLVLPSWACNLVKRSELKDASLAGDGTSLVRNGRIGMIDQFTIYKSNNVSKVIDSGTTNPAWNIMAGHKSALTFASQMTNMEELPNPNKFGRLVRGLNVYGYQVIKPEALAHLYAEKG